MYRSFVVLLISLVCIVIAGTPVDAQNQPIFTDHFDDGILDPAWQVTFESGNGFGFATGWDFDESVAESSYLTVRDITGNNSGTGDTWQVVLTRNVTPLENFHITTSISWSSEGPAGEALILASHSMLFSAIDGNNGTIIGRAGYSDAWGNDFGTRLSAIPLCCIDPSSLPASGSAVIELDRTGNVFTFIWDGTTIFTTTISNQPMEKVKINFEFPETSSHMGTLAVDYITIEGTPVAPTLSCVGFDPPAHQPISVKKPNRVLPLKMVLLDSNGQPVSDGTIQNPPILEVDLVSTSGGTEPPGELISAGLGDEGNQFAFTDGRWQFNLKMKNFSGSGAYEATVVSGDSNEYFIAQPTCTATFTIANN